MTYCWTKTNSLWTCLLRRHKQQKVECDWVDVAVLVEHWYQVHSNVAQFFLVSMFVIIE